MDDNSVDFAEVIVGFLFLLGASTAFALAVSYLVAAVLPLFDRKPPKPK